MTLYVQVVLPLPLDKVFTYTVPESWIEMAQVGTRVLIPFGPRMLTGFVVGRKKRLRAEGLRLKEIAKVLDEEPVFSSRFLKFTRRLSKYYYASWGEILQASLPPSFILRTRRRVSLTEKGKAAAAEKALTEAERSILDFLGCRSYSDVFLRRRLKVKNLSSLLHRLEEKGLIAVARDVQRTSRRAKTPSPGKTEQLEIDFSLDRGAMKAAEILLKKGESGGCLPLLLVGQREKRHAVYFSLLKQTLEKGRRVLVLVPEIAWTATLEKRFTKTVGKSLALLHSGLPAARREAEWWKIKRGDAEVVVGPRLALFAPVEDLGLIIVDEEQDDSYVQKESPHYDARRGARLRARQDSAVLVYGSEAPTVETFFEAKRRGSLFRLERMPRKASVQVVEDRHRRDLIPPAIDEKISTRIARKERALVFVNRRGYAPFLICSECRYVPRCPQCDIGLTYHKKQDELVCRYCNSSFPLMETCPECGGRILHRRGYGTESVEEALSRLFPEARVASFDTDLVKSRQEQERILSKFQSGKIDVLVGTQFLAHRVDLPPVSLTAVLQPEVILNLSDFRASQHAFLNLHQMMGFLRREEEAEGLILTSLPHHYSIVASCRDDYDFFYRHEIRYRRLMNYPPFAHMVEILFQDEDLRLLARRTREFSQKVLDRDGGDVEVLGPALASVARIRGRHRVQLVLKARAKKSLDSVLGETLAEVKGRKSVFVYG